jgi:hypothetical protein
VSTQTIARLVISAIVVIGFGSIVIAFLQLPAVPNAQSNFVSMLIGALISGYLQVIHYWFTSGGEPQQ